MDTSRPTVSGLLALNKPLHVTSRDCVNSVERILRQRFPKPLRLPKVGHAGTLDPLATGVLVMGIGSGVRLVPYIQQMTKYYDATFRLGCWTDSGDLDGELHLESDAIAPTMEQLQIAASRLVGDITQIPPSTSAIRVGGKRAYHFAHRGIAVEVPSRIVNVESISITDYAYPELKISIACGSGTYVRTLGMDLAIACQTRGVMTRLQRTRIGDFALSACQAVESLTPDSLERAMLPLSVGVSQLPKLMLSTNQYASVMLGQKTPAADISWIENGSDEAVVLDAEGELRAILRRKEDRWCPYRVFHPAPPSQTS